MRLRQIALVAGDLQVVRQQFFTLLGLEADFADTGVAEFGLENSVMALGDTFLEVVSPTRPDTTAGRLLARRQGDGGYMVLFQVNNLAPFYQHTEEKSVRKVWQTDVTGTRAFHLHPKDIGGAIVSLDQMSPPESWRRAGPDWQHRKAKLVTGIVAVDIQADDPGTMALRWGEVLKASVEAANGGTWRLGLKGSWVNFVPTTDDRGDGLAAVEIRTADYAPLQENALSLELEWQDNTVSLCGTRIRFTKK